ncbi:dipeptidyl aminopeptidase/acylaminoacyl peptidase [Nitrospirillum amazonense]|uniref:Dipeptidyl aminopeptidase/acylaminoacyl peptidase n=1 Tax=Nitrospirillum amazonense TaxID=28077 RepID=A0A560KGU1_9PROT|nr:S9 family peptidase [Nitrospirillum amazonense]TWB79850.1 dipeptidyl aminopeptidase/acylaminoacyl peptidase [Nitrospirillum amazonense]
MRHSVTRVLAGALLAGCAFTALDASAQAVEKKPLTHETLWMMKRVGAPITSPNGKWVLFSMVEPSYEQDKSVTDLWLVPTDGSAAPRRLTNTKGGESDPVWSPDSGSIAFAAKREGDEVEQIYVLDLAQGGEARRVTTVSTGASHPQWRPDGKAILFESRVFPGATDDEANKKIAAERKARKYNVRTYEHFPVRYWNEWLDDRQPTVMVQGLEPGAVARDILSSTAFAHTDGFSGMQGESSVSLSPIWSPDGGEIVFEATQARWNAAFAHVPYHLYRIPAAGGAEPREVTAAPGGYGHAAFSPDGKNLYFTYMPQNDEVYNLPRLSRVAWPAGGAATLVARDFDRQPTQYALSPDSRTVYLLAPDGASENLYSVPAEGGKPALVAQPKVGGYTALSLPKSGKLQLIAQYGSSVNPAEIVRIDPNGKASGMEGEKGGHTNLTNIDTAIAAGIDWQPPQHFTFTSAKGRTIHSMIVLPPHFDPNMKYPLFVFIHGGAASNNPDQIGLRWNYHLLAASAGGTVILMTDYTGSTGFGEAFAQAIKLDPLKTPADEINQAADEAIRRFPFIDASRQCAGGASYGGHLTNWLEATTTRYRCLVSHAGEVDLLTQWGESDGIYNREVNNGGPPWEGNAIWREQSPITYAANWKTPMLMSIGERDYRVPLGNTLEAWAVLQHQHVPSRLLVWPDAWHWITKPEDSRHFYQEVGDWLAKYLQATSP